VHPLSNRAINLSLRHRFDGQDVSHNDGFVPGLRRIIAFVSNADELFI
jgi:hypothetical protein